jgi:hypothetical protein
MNPLVFYTGMLGIVLIVGLFIGLGVCAVQEERRKKREREAEHERLRG